MGVPSVVSGSIRPQPPAQPPPAAYSARAFGRFQRRGTGPPLRSPAKPLSPEQQMQIQQETQAENSSTPAEEATLPQAGKL